MATALTKVWGRGGVFGCECSLVPLPHLRLTRSFLSLPGSQHKFTPRSDSLTPCRSLGTLAVGYHRSFDVSLLVARCALLGLTLLSNSGRVVSCCSPLLRLKAPRATWGCLRLLLDCSEAWEEESRKPTRRWESAHA